ncbi:hypothetical protein JMA_01830 [Jeotgalibacillus malaysiensis]|uniref:Uncharacterized protein n=1 Tax=Jeotgalibacillus malaysiensis TaxID=1508404 RepID=A0A0B5AGM8_9BACL|nr:hypothetical protein [Jeotgalibacillus malaysiensis]AJD89500.1 hypothetical protein JMA_01830 [Jeotgalibacillus malaysiensis]
MKKYKTWKRIYLALLILFGILIPLELLVWLFGSEKFPFTTIAIGAFIFVYRKRHLEQLENQAF